MGKDFLLINRLKAVEEISSLYAFEVELLREEKEAGFEPTVINPDSLLGQAAVIEIYQRDGNTRILNGIINHFSQGHRDTRFSYYNVTIVPDVWLLTQRSQSRIFQHKSVPDILREVLQGFDISYELQGSFKPRNYCVQYGETDFDFVSRLMEEEGIYYLFEHTRETNRMIIANTPQSHPDCPSKSDIPFSLKVTEAEEVDDFISSIRKWQNDYRLQSGKVAFRDYNFQVPSYKLDADQSSRFKVANNDKLEVYDFPGGYAKQFDDINRSGGERSDVQNVFEDKQKKAEIAMQSLDSQYRIITGNSDCSTLTAGHRFKLFNHPVGKQNGQYIVTKITHQAEQSPIYISEDRVPQPYANSFQCIAYGQGNPPFRPARKTLKPKVYGSQTAFVVGPAGEEIFTDKFGRVKVQFHWDRESQIEVGSHSCWIRVAQAWAGNRWGMMFIPRIGMEVIIKFLEGDPDQPIISGCVYNPSMMPPYKLPDEKTRMTIKSNSSKGGKGFNELRFEDKQGAEQIFIHAERNKDIRVENDLIEWVGQDTHLIVKRDQIKCVEADQHLTVGNDKSEKVGGTVSLTAGTDIREKAGADYALQAGNEIHLIAGTNLVLESGATITIKAGGGFITIGPEGISIKGVKVKINSTGVPGNGAGASPELPKQPAEADGSPR